MDRIIEDINKEIQEKATIKANLVIIFDSGAREVFSDITLQDAEEIKGDFVDWGSMQSSQREYTFHSFERGMKTLKPTLRIDFRKVSMIVVERIIW